MLNTISEFFAGYGDILLTGTRDTLVMVLVSTLFAYLLGLPLGVALTVTQPHGIRPNKAVNQILGWIVNIGRSIPFIILMVAIMPFTKLVVGTKIKHEKGKIVKRRHRRHVDNWGGVSFIQAAESYTLDGIIVTGDKEYDRFGNVITEQSYYRTGGDVDVITSQTLEKRHYAQLGDALKSVPGVQVQSPGGYRGGEYGYTQTHSIVTINGDARVVVMIDGRRMDNKAGGIVAGNSGSGSKAMVDINQITSMDNIDKIEVIKGPGASVYGADATGGVINIITKKGTQKTSGSVDFSAG